METRRGVRAPAVLTEAELPAIVEAIKESGAFAFDVETRGVISRHPDVVAKVEAEWEAKKASLKSEHPSTLERSRRAIEEAWEKRLALDPFRNEVFWIAIAVEGRSWAIPMGHPNGEVLVKEMRGDGTTVPPSGHRKILKSGKESMAKSKFFIPAVFTDPPEQLSKETVFGYLEEVFLDPTIDKINQNVKFDCKSVAKYIGGRLPEGRYIDTQVETHIMDENMMKYDLTSVIWRSYQYDPYRGDKLGSTITTESFRDATEYVHRDARWAWLVHQRLWRVLGRNSDLFSVLQRECDVLRPICLAEFNGIPVDTRAIHRLGQDLDAQINDCIRDIYMQIPSKFPGGPETFNPSSNPDKVKLLFNKKREGGLGLKPTKFTASTARLPADQRKPSVDDESLKGRQGEHPVVDLIMDYQTLTKMKSTFVEGLGDQLHPYRGHKNLGIAHPSFHLHRTATGRLSSSDPNLQNIPRDGAARSLFVAGPDESLVVADYSQIEMRLMAMFSQDPEMLKVFSDGIDAHSATAAVILYGRADAEVTKDERQEIGKVANFLLGYGGMAKRLQRHVNTHGGFQGRDMTYDEADAIVKGYNNGYAGLTDWKQEVLAYGRRYGYVETMGGRRRRLPDLNADRTTQDGWKARVRAERQAINHVIQGTAAEICKDAMIAVDKVLEWPKCRMVLQVHDELVSLVPTDEVVTWTRLIEDAMGNGVVLDNLGRVPHGVPLEVEAHFAGSWYDAKS